MNIISRMAVFLFASAVVSQAQFSDLAANGDGSELFFASSLRERGTAQYLHPKIFAIKPGGVELVAQVEREGIGFTNYYRLSEPDASADGSVVSWTATRECQGGSSCFLNEQSSATIRMPGGERSAGGHVRLSRNGRYALSYNSSNSMIWRTVLMDLETGASVDLKLRPRIRPTVASDGTALLHTGSLLLVKDGRTRTLAGGEISAAVMDDGATIVVFERPSRLLWVVDTESGSTWQLGPGDRASYAPAISADGTRVLYLSATGGQAQVFSSRPDGSDWRQLTDDPDGIRQAVLSGDGRVAWALTESGAIVQIEIASGFVAQRIAPIPYAREIAGGHAPGSANIIAGSALALPPGSGVTLDGGAAPLLFTSPGSLIFQVPWEQPVGPEGEREIVLSLPGGDPAFEAAYPYTLRDFDPAVLPLGDPDPSGESPYAVHEDFGSLVTPASPSAPGEIVHLFLTGLGPVTPPVETGRPAPLNALSRLAAPWQFQFVTAAPSMPADVLFAGLAPGTTGFYQLDVRMPASATDFIYLEGGLLRDTGVEIRVGLVRIPFQP